MICYLVVGASGTYQKHEVASFRLTVFQPKLVKRAKENITSLLILLKLIFEETTLRGFLESSSSSLL
jgi:hypothetical protein